MHRAFGLCRELHQFRTEDSIGWASFTEPQFTKGIAWFLDSSSPMVRAERVRALLKALGASELADDLNGIKVSAETDYSRRKQRATPLHTAPAIMGTKEFCVISGTPLVAETAGGKPGRNQRGRKHCPGMPGFLRKRSDPFLCSLVKVNARVCTCRLPRRVRMAQMMRHRGQLAPCRLFRLGRWRPRAVGVSPATAWSDVDARPQLWPHPCPASGLCVHWIVAACCTRLNSLSDRIAAKSPPTDQAFPPFPGSCRPLLRSSC